VSNFAVQKAGSGFSSGGAFLGLRSGRRFPIWLLQVTQIKKMLLSYYNNEKKYLIIHSNIHIIIAHQLDGFLMCQNGPAPANEFGLTEMQKKKT
jgi:hypothetical protein